MSLNPVLYFCVEIIRTVFTSVTNTNDCTNTNITLTALEGGLVHWGWLCRMFLL